MIWLAVSLQLQDIFVHSELLVYHYGPVLSYMSLVRLMKISSRKVNLGEVDFFVLSLSKIVFSVVPYFYWDFISVLSAENRRKSIEKVKAR